MHCLYVIGGWNGFDTETDYDTLAEAAEALRIAEGWTEIHLSGKMLTTEASLPTWVAYPTANARDADSGWESAPVIYQLA